MCKIQKLIKKTEKYLSKSEECFEKLIKEIQSKKSKTQKQLTVFSENIETHNSNIEYLDKKLTTFF